MATEVKNPSTLHYHGCHVQLRRLLTAQGHPAEGVARGRNPASIVLSVRCAPRRSDACACLPGGALG